MFVTVSARLYGDYETLVIGYAADALVDFTGGVAEKLDLNDRHLEDEEDAERLFLDLHEASENKALIVCNIAVSVTVIGHWRKTG